MQLQLPKSSRYIQRPNLQQNKLVFKNIEANLQSQDEQRRLSDDSPHRNRETAIHTLQVTINQRDQILPYSLTLDNKRSNNQFFHMPTIEHQ
jgi:hypothetical protein